MDIKKIISSVSNNMAVKRDAINISVNMDEYTKEELEKTLLHIKIYGYDENNPQPDLIDEIQLKRKFILSSLDFGAKMCNNFLPIISSIPMKGIDIGVLFPLILKIIMKCDEGTFAILIEKNKYKNIKNEIQDLLKNLKLENSNK